MASDAVSGDSEVFAALDELGFLHGGCGLRERARRRGKHNERTGKAHHKQENCRHAVGCPGPHVSSSAMICAAVRSATAKAVSVELLVPAVGSTPVPTMKRFSCSCARP